MGRIQYEDYEPAHLSYSTVNGFRECGKRLYLQKIAKVEQVPGLAAIGGNAVHSATEKLDLARWQSDTRNEGNGKEAE